ncbi:MULTISPECIES: hypothetical protein [Cyanophyceae]|uniref:Uncharacterized protein n=1 Tax=Leptolyngbya subtilissima DQ-A4 TaxID=2933933 RepID=A0ABV0JZM3_9CYAN|nr:hypothetical protein [Nodosilinea sp. FACHB-141]MBD2112599.1 hypothetical protein [Nodosilinea sp. FACHB-141]
MTAQPPLYSAILLTWGMDLRPWCRVCVGDRGRTFASPQPEPWGGDLGEGGSQ